MNFKSLKEKGEYYRSLTDYRLLPNSYAVIMLDGRSFSHKIKNKFKKPFDEDFVKMMNETTKYLCENIQGALLGYCQSDEIHIVISDYVKSYKLDEDWSITPTDKEGISSAFFQYRISKILSIVASMATSKFNQLMMDYRVSHVESDSGCAGDTVDDCRQAIMSSPLYEFDCKVWNLPNANEVYAWLLYRQIDCIKNSKQQLCQTYLPHKTLVGLNSDKQIELLKEEKNIDWNEFPDDVKNGRIVFRTENEYKTEDGVPYIRSKWVVQGAKKFDKSRTDKDIVTIDKLINGAIIKYKN